MAHIIFVLDIVVLNGSTMTIYRSHIEGQHNITENQEFWNQTDNN